MRIGVDATCWSNRRGYGRFARALLSAVLAVDRENEYVFFTDSACDEFPMPANIEVVRAAAGVPTIRAAAANGRRSLRDLWTVSRAIASRRLDLIFFPSVYSYVPVMRSVPELVTIHDVIPELFPQLVFPTRRSKLFWQAKVKLACRRAHRVLTVSEYSRKCVAEQFKLPASRLRVVNEASDPAFRRLDRPDRAALAARLGMPAASRFLSYVGGFSPHKNLPLLVDVFRELRSESRFADLRLVLVGDFESDVFFSCYRELLEQVKNSGLAGHVIFSGYMGDADLVQLLNLTDALVLPSFCEGFGLPAVEAAACGAPVVATTASPLPGLLGQGAIAVDPGDRAGWHAAIARVLGDPALREKMGAAGVAAAGRLSWENSARQLLEIFSEVKHPRVATR